MIPKVTIPEGKNGPWTISRFTVPDEPSIATLRLAMSGRPVYPGTYTRLHHERRGLVMSDTPAEQDDHRAFVRAASGHVLINGLGIGMCLGAVMAKPNVDKITVVEIDGDLIELVAPHYYAPHVQIVHADAFEYQPPKGIRYGAVWHDIWDEICEDNRPAMSRLHRKYGRLTDWQGSWGKDTMDRERARERRNPWRW